MLLSHLLSKEYIGFLRFSFTIISGTYLLVKKRDSFTGLTKESISLLKQSYSSKEHRLQYCHFLFGQGRGGSTSVRLRAFAIYDRERSSCRIWPTNYPSSLSSLVFIRSTVRYFLIALYSPSTFRLYSFISLKRSSFPNLPRT